MSSVVPFCGSIGSQHSQHTVLTFAKQPTRHALVPNDSDRKPTNQGRLAKPALDMLPWRRHGAARGLQSCVVCR